MNAHTPGPWHCDESCGGLAIESKAHGNVGLVNLARASKADAQLIAAAPELLHALQALMDAWPEGEACINPASSAFDLAYAAIAKVEGK